MAQERDPKSVFRLLRGDAAPIDGKFVSDRIKTIVRPRLAEIGFDNFSGRTAWRHRETTIEVVNFRSPNSYNAEVAGCTTLSFGVGLGCFLRAIPPHPMTGYSMPDVKRPKPSNLVCTFRVELRHGIKQDDPRWTTLWYVDPKARNLDAILADALLQIEQVGLPLLESLQDLDEALRVLEHDDEVMSGGLWGFGNHGSSVRNWNIGHMALAARRPEVAERAFTELLASDASNEYRPLIEAALGRARSTRREKR